MHLPRIEPPFLERQIRNLVPLQTELPLLFLCQSAYTKILPGLTRAWTVVAVRQWLQYLLKIG
jgi:hypothetical protein